MGCSRVRFTAVLCALLGGCEKVPLGDIDAKFRLADATWFAEESTLFIFYELQANQGLGPLSQVEISYRTDDVEVPWTDVATLSTVHTHLPVDCGIAERCGGTSVRVDKPPRDVGVRLRYHRDSQMTLEAKTQVNLVGEGPPHTHRSLIVYGVFDEANRHVQWRARHQFPALRNHDVERLGLRRTLQVSTSRFGDISPWPDGNPYGYGLGSSCPAALTPLGFAPIGTSERAVFDGSQLPLTASSSGVVCGEATVHDARGTFTAPALARKNPEVRPAFPQLRSPIRINTPVGFLLHPCDRTISDAHHAMQTQRLLLDGAVEICLDDWRDARFVDTVAARVRARVDEVRLRGQDMVLTVAFHHDDAGGQLAGKLEQALEQVLTFERDKSSPRVSGAFVFDSYGRSVARPELNSLVLWCPATRTRTLEEIPSTAQRSCPLQPDIPELKLGPFSFSSVPILATREQYLDFIAKYTEAQAGKVTSLDFRAPERTPLSVNIPVGGYGVATFFNNETVSAQPTDSFSFCASGDLGALSAVFRVTGIPAPLPLAALPDRHLATPQSSYPLGLFWDFPFLSRLRYEVFFAGAASAMSFTVPFGISGSDEAYQGTMLWERGEFPLSEVLLQCSRFCDHPTFDSAGVYNVQAAFRAQYRNHCYRPRYPVPGDGGSPLDP